MVVYFSNRNSCSVNIITEPFADTFIVPPDSVAKITFIGAKSGNDFIIEHVKEGLILNGARNCYDIAVEITCNFNEKNFWHDPSSTFISD